MRDIEASESARLRVDDNSEESAFFERGDDSEVLGPMTSDRDADPARVVSTIESVRRRGKLRRVVAGIVGIASVLAALAAVKAMVAPARGSLEPSPEPIEPVVIVMQRLGAVVSPAAGSSLSVPSAEGLVCRAAAQCEPGASADDGAETSDEVGASTAAPSASPSKKGVGRHLAHGRRNKNRPPRRQAPGVAPAPKFR